MIATVINHDDSRESIIIVVLEPDNLDRMRRADPVTLETKLSDGVLDAVKYPDRLRLLIAYEENDVELWKQARSGGLLHYLLRGVKWLRDLDGSDKAFSITKGREAEKGDPK